MREGRERDAANVGEEITGHSLDDEQAPSGASFRTETRAWPWGARRLR